MDQNLYKLKSRIYILAGGVFLLVGIVGIFVPLLPTTPFLLLTAFCFDKGSKKFHSWLLRHKYLGPPIADWQKRHVIRTKYKSLATIMLVASVTYIGLQPNTLNIVKYGFAIFVIGVSYFIWTRKSA